MEKTVINGEHYVITDQKVGEYLVCRKPIDDERNLYGIINSNHEFILPCEYAHFMFKSNGICITNRHGFAGVLNASLDTVLPFEYEQIYSLPVAAVNLYAIKKDGKYGVLNESFKPILPCEYDKIECLKQFDTNAFSKWLLVRKNKLYGVASLTGTIIIPCEYDQIIANVYRFTMRRYNQAVTYEIETGKISGTIEITLDHAINRVRCWLIQPKGSNMIFDETQPVINDYGLRYSETVSFYERYYQRDTKHSFKELLIYALCFIGIFIISLFVLPHPILGVIVSIGVIGEIIIREHNSNKKKKEQIQEDNRRYKRYFVDLAKWAYDWERIKSDEHHSEFLNEAVNYYIPKKE